MSFYDLASTPDPPAQPLAESPGTVVAGSGKKGPFASLGTGTPAAHESAGRDEGAGALPAVPQAPPAPGDLPKYPGMFRRVLKSCSTEAPMAALDAAAEMNMTLAEYVKARADEVVAQLVRDNAPRALQELRRVQG